MKRNVMRPLTEAEMQKRGSGSLAPYIPSISSTNGLARQVNVPKLVVFK